MEATGSLRNFRVQAQIGGTDEETAFRAAVSELLERLTGKMAWHALRTPYLANSTGDRVWRPEPVRRDLIDGVSRTVRWYDGVSMMQELGVERFVEISLDGTLTAIGRRCAPELQWLRLDHL